MKLRRIGIYAADLLLLHDLAWSNATKYNDKDDFKFGCNFRESDVQFAWRFTGTKEETDTAFKGLPSLVKTWKHDQNIHANLADFAKIACVRYEGALRFYTASSAHSARSSGIQCMELTTTKCLPSR